MSKQRILTSQTKPGMKIADDVFTPNGQLILSAGTVISDKVITRLKFYSVHQITIELEEPQPEVSKQAPPKIEYFSERIRKSNDFKAFSSTVAKSAEHLHGQLNNIVERNDAIDANSLIHDVDAVLENARNGMHVFDMLHCMRNYDDETYLHSLNVAMISNVLGRWLNFSARDLDILTLSGILHDIGKLKIPHEIVHKNGKLSDDEYNIIKTHPVRGYNILRAQKNVDIHVQMSCMMHHERCDGSGYPMNLKGDQIDKFAKIVMIADVYDAMTAARVYRGPLCPFEVIHFFETEGLTKFEPRYIMTFLEHLHQTYVNNTVRLSDKSVGEIVMMKPNSMSRPVIRVGERFIDLANEPDLYIEALL